VSLSAELDAILSDPLAFARAVPGYQGDVHGRKQFGDFHRKLVDEARSSTRVSIVVPRNHAKTTLFSHLLVAWEVIRSRGAVRCLIGSATLALAKANAGEVRRILEGDLLLGGHRVPLVRVFPWAAPINPRRSEGPTASFNIVGRSGLGKEPTLFTGAPGTNLAGTRPNLIILDDIVNEQNSRTRERREQGVQFIAQVEALAYDAQTPIRMVSTPWANGDATDHVRTRPGWKQLRHPIYIGPPDPATGLRPTVCPSFISPEEARDMETTARAMNRFAFFSAQYLLEPLSSDDPLFTNEMLGFARSKGVALDALPTRGASDFLLWDPVATVEVGASGIDRNGLVVIRAIPATLLPWAVPDPSRNVFFPVFAAEIAGGADAALHEIERWVQAKRWPLLKSIWIEDVAAQIFLAPWAKARGRIQGVSIRGQKIKGHDLMLRLSGLQTAIREGYFVIPQGFEGQALLEKRLLEFPVGDYDDLPAALALLTSHIERRGALPGDDPPVPFPYERGGPGNRPGPDVIVL
jgi:hypothetical protein